MKGIFFKFTEVLPSGQDEVRREEVNEEEEGGIEYWSEEEWGEEWEQWEFVTEDDEEDQEYEEDEEDEGDEEDDDDEEEEEEEDEQDQEEDMGEGGASVAMDLRVVCVTRPRHASIIHGDTGHQVCCLECASRLKTDKKRCPVCRKKIKLVVKNFF